MCIFKKKESNLNNFLNITLMNCTELIWMVNLKSASMRFAEDVAPAVQREATSETAAVKTTGRRISSMWRLTTIQSLTSRTSGSPFTGADSHQLHSWLCFSPLTFWPPAASARVSSPRFIDRLCKQRATWHRSDAAARSFLPPPRLTPLPVPYLVDGTHACDGPDVVGDGDQRRSGQVLLADAVPLLFAHHVTKAVKKSGGELFNSLIDSRRAKNAAKPWEERKNLPHSCSHGLQSLCFMARLLNTDLWV